MPKEKHSDNPSKFVTVEDCKLTHRKIELALWGEDGRGGIVKDIGDIKGSTEKRWTGRDWAYLIVGVSGVFGSMIAAYLAYLASLA